MIYRVGDNEITAYDRNTIKAPQPKSGGETFNLNQYVDDKNRQDGKREKQTEESTPQDISSKGGVKLNLSGSPRSALPSFQSAHAGETAQTAGSVMEQLRDFFVRFVAKCKEILYRIWNDPPSEEDIAAADKTQSTVSGKGVDVQGEEAERITEEYRRMKGLDYVHVPDIQTPPGTEKERDVEIRRYLHKGNLNQVLDILTDNGQRRMAKNSTLLTYYDKSGRIAELNASDKERILHGDRNTRKL